MIKIIFFVILVLVNNVYSALFISDIEPGIRLDSISADGYWEIKMPAGYLIDGSIISGVSSLNYKSLKNDSLAAFINFKILGLLDFHLSYHPENYLEINKQKGYGVDSDMLTAKKYWPLLFCQSRFDVENKNIYFNTDVSVKIKRLKFFNNVLIINTLFGYMKNIENISMRNGIQTYSDNTLFSNEKFPEPGTVFNDLNSRYKFDWDTLKIGLNFNFHILSFLNFQISYAFLYNFFSGEGFWNLRTYSATGGMAGAWRNEPPSFIHYDAKGWGRNLNLGLTLKLIKQLGISVGYSYIYQFAKEGKEKLFFYDASKNSNAEDIEVSRVEFIKKIFLTGLSYTF